MKQELESEIALDIHSLNQCDEVVPTHPSEIDAGLESQLMFSVEVSENPGGIVKSSVANGYIVYTRMKKSRHLCNGSSENGSLKRLKTSEDRDSNADLPAVGGGDDVGVNNVEKNFESEVVCHLEKGIRCTEWKNEPAQFLAGEGGSNKAPAELFNNSEVQKNVNITVKRFTRSALKPKVECSDETATAPEAAQTANNRPDEKETAALSASTPRSKLELKMSKKIVLSKKPMTVKELFDTGLLDGVSVVYMGGKASGLRGVIADGGILCSCCLCNGRKVIPPSQFEIHACKSYRRAAQYICFENGKSLLELLRACRGTPLHTLETTIQNFVCSLPQEKYYTCKRCKGCFPSSRVEKVGAICKTCVESKKSGDSFSDTVGIRVRSPRAVPASKPLTDTELCNSSQINKHWKKRTRTTNRVSSSKSSETASLSVLSRKKSPQRLKKSTKISVKLETPLISSDSKCLSSQDKTQWKITKKDQRLHKLVFEEGGLPDGTEVAYYGRGQKLLEGYKKGFGIFCRCCNTEVSPSQFEVHAGWASRRKPYAYIYTSNGVSLHELAISLSKGRKYSAKDNDDLCIICWDGGNLLLCDGCPRAFHKECASLSSIPRGDWYCKFCQNMFQRERFVAHNANAVAAGRVDGVDPIEQITKRCIRIVKDIEAELSGCALCGGYDFSKSGFGPRTIILCDQCEKEYHVGCLRDHKMAYLKELPEGNWFCCTDCNRIHSTLQKFLVRGAEKLPDSLVNVIKTKQEEKGLQPFNDIDVRWRLLNGKIASPETRPLLLEAVSIFHECFDPIVDSTSGRDLIPAMVYGRNVRSQEYGGMYCAILSVNSTVVSAGMLRIFGKDVAELPLVATSNGNHGKGYFQLLFTCIQRLLALLTVKKLVLPAAEEAESIWTDKFGFHKMKPEQISDCRRNYSQILTFQGTSMLQKMVPPCQVLNVKEENS
ncbi:uncharacterized protein LOC114733823 isoform X2 [Neltuma alba]|uniref:uncharacterized protein LOC114733823 isoform X2 n=1 Tax=Neltuma alba TaxID=207710 RepID=UPI0010A3FA6C|nr:uncharacterized protein LOC114733823 isoform X2 [Prosopis alba]